MRAGVYREPGLVEAADVDDPELQPGDLLVEVAACGVCGSDLDSWRSGAYVSPGQVMGHEIGGRVLQGGHHLGLDPGTPVALRPMLPCGECPRCLEGNPQLCDRSIGGGIGYGLPGGFAVRVRVPAARHGVNVYALPAHLDPSLGALVEPLAVALRSVHHAAVRRGGSVLVFGLGTIGLGAVALAALQGPAQVIGVDPSPLRRDTAQRLGATLTIDPTAGDVVAAVREVTGPGGYGLGAAADVTIECSGAPSAFSAAVKSTRHGGALVLVAHSHEPFAVRSGRIIEKELRVQGSFAYRDEMGEVVGLLEAGRLDLPAFVSHRFPLEQVGEAFRVQADAGSSLKVLVQP